MRNLRPVVLKNPLRLALFLLLTILQGTPHSAQAQRTQPVLVVAPPQPVEQALKVKRGARTEIALRIYGKKNETLKFLIRIAPRHGRLSEPRVLDKEVSSVIYTPPADLAITQDQFSYAVQNSAGVSAAVDVALTITDLPPQLAIPGPLVFPKILAGETATQVIELSNQGGSLAEGEVLVNAPWKVEGKSSYQLGAGDSAVFKITFAPRQGGVFDSVIRFTSDPEHSTGLKGEAVAAISATPEKVLLQSIPGDAVRQGDFALSNQTDEPRTVILKTSERLEVPGEVTVPAQGKATVTVRAAGSAEPVSTEVHIESAGSQLVVPVEAGRLGAVLRVTQSALNFGRIAVAGASAASAEVELENVGGAPLGVAWQLSAPFTIGQNSAILLPREKKTFAVRLQSAPAGKYRSALKLKTEQQTLEIPVEAELVGPAPGASARATSPMFSNKSTAADTGESSPPVAAARPSIQREPMIPLEWTTNPNLPAGVKLAALTPTAAALEWPVALHPATRFRIEWRNLGIDAGKNLAVTWVEYRSASVQRVGDRYVARLPELTPAQPFAIRVLPIGASGQLGSRLFAVNFVTPPKPGILAKVTPLRGLVTAFSLCVAFLIWQRLRTRKRGWSGGSGL